jgi:phosphoenolpyruvate-protein phosphotransferase (PTS system enzyme I)
MMSHTHQAIHLKGTPSSPGIGIGSAWVLKERKVSVRPEKITADEVQENLAKFTMAVETLSDEYIRLQKLSDKEASEIIEAQIQTLSDPELHRLVNQKIEVHHYGVVYAIFSTFNEYIQLMEASGSAWLEERTIDIVTIRDQLIEAARNRRQEIRVSEGDVVFAVDISPTVMIELSKVRIAGIVMQKGGLTSHAVILSQSLGIPCVIGVKWNQLNIPKGTPVVLDGETGEIVIWPDDKEVKDFRARLERYHKVFTQKLKIAAKPHETACGKPFSVRANVEFEEELPRISLHGARGVGLLRTETILFRKRGLSIADQAGFYDRVLSASGNDPVTIRLFDAGGDKLLDNSEEEANPFLGWRGVRLLLDEEELLMNQLEAILRVSGKHPGRVQLLVPMVSELDEVLKLKEVLQRVKDGLTIEEVKFDEKLPFGIMVEVPAVALAAGEFAQHADFFSIGTNDLTQYTLAVDRGNEKIAGLFQPFHPAVWKLIGMTIDGAAEAGIPVAVCGEMASKPQAAACLMGMGIRELSMTTNAIPAVKSMLCSKTLKEMQHLARETLEAGSSAEIEELFRKFADEES